MNQRPPSTGLARDEIVVALTSLGEDPTASRVDALHARIDAAALPAGERADVVRAAVDAARVQLDASAPEAVRMLRIIARFPDQGLFRDTQQDHADVTERVLSLPLAELKQLRDHSKEASLLVNPRDGDRCGPDSVEIEASICAFFGVDRVTALSQTHLDAVCLPNGATEHGKLPENEDSNDASKLAMEPATRKLFNVTLDWEPGDDEQGDYATSVWARDEDEATRLVAEEMADSGEVEHETDDERASYIERVVAGAGQFAVELVESAVDRDLANLLEDRPDALKVIRGILKGEPALLALAQQEAGKLPDAAPNMVPQASLLATQTALSQAMQHAEAIEKQRDRLIKALSIIGSQSLGDDWTAEQAIAFVKQHAREERNAVIAQIRAVEANDDEDNESQCRSSSPGM